MWLAQPAGWCGVSRITVRQRNIPNRRSKCRHVASECRQRRPPARLSHCSLTLSLALTQPPCWNTRWFCHKRNWVTAHICLATCCRRDDRGERQSHCDVSRKHEMPRRMRCLLGQFFPFFSPFNRALSASVRRSTESTGWLQWCEGSALNRRYSTWRAACCKCQKILSWKMLGSGKKQASYITTVLFSSHRYSKKNK